MSDPASYTFATSPSDFLATLRDDTNRAVSYATPTPMICEAIEAETGYIFVREVGSDPLSDEVHEEPYPRLAGPPILPEDYVLVAEVMGRGESGGSARVVLGKIGDDERTHHYLDMADFGLSEDGTFASNKTAFMAAVTAANLLDVPIIVRAGTYKTNFIRISTVDNPLLTDIHIIGAGSSKTTFLLPGTAGGTEANPAFAFTNINNAKLIGVSFQPELEANRWQRLGVWVNQSDDCYLEDVTSSGFSDGIRVQGRTTDLNNWAERNILNRCGGYSNSGFGIVAYDVKVLTLNDCQGRMNGLDGGKLAIRAFNVTVNRGVWSDNGRCWVDPLQPYYQNAGDGIDCYGGGDRLVINGGVFERNYGNGITIKTDTGTDDDPQPATGYVRRCQIVGVRCNDQMLGSGMGFYTFHGGTLEDDIPTMPSAQQCVILGGEFSNNPGYGFWINGHQVSAIGCSVIGNTDRGILIGKDAWYVDLDGCHVAGNGNGTQPGIAIYGHHIAVRGGSILGVWLEEHLDDASLAAGTKKHTYNVMVDVLAGDILIDVPFQNYAITNGIVVNMTSGVCIVHQREDYEAAVPNVNIIYGSVGSTYIQADGTKWHKVAGAPNVGGAWKKDGALNVRSVSASDTASAGDDVILVTTGASTRTITLPPAAAIEGVPLTIKKVDSGVGNVLVEGNGTETVDGSLNREIQSQYGAVSVVSNGANWSIVNQMGTIV